MTQTLLVVFGVVLLFAVWRAPPLRARRTRKRQWRDWLRRRHRRIDRLTNAGLSLEPLLALSQLVSEHDPFDVESLLDRCVELVLARQHCLVSLYGVNPKRLASRSEAVALRAPALSSVLQRRLAQARDVATRAAVLEESIGTLCELIRYCAERAALPAGAASSGPVPDILASLEADDEVELALAG